jgi:putative heme-binding domain-containing protein
MRIISILPTVLVFFLIPGLGNGSILGDELTFRDSERIVLLGDGLIEQEQYHGWIELAMTTAMPDKDLTFRNLGWNGDTPHGASRLGLSLVQAGYGKEDEGWKQLVKQIELVKPTVVILGYGMASSLEEPFSDTAMVGFLSEYEELLGAIRKTNPRVRFVFLSPITPTGKPAGTKARHASDIFADFIKSLAAVEKSPFVDLSDIPSDGRFHQDPIHLNSDGYREAAKLICKTLKLPESDWQSSANAEALRQEILQKNVWWFHRSRPANMAYVFGFRKKEQGQNAIEIPQYDALLEQAEARIAKLRDLKTTVDPAEPKTESKFAKFTAQPTPEFTIAEGFSVSLFAENPMLNKPIHMNFDPQGRLWVASSEAYPMIEVGQSNPDKVIVLEDTTGDGKADKSSVFADGLLIPTGILPGDGGVYVAQSTDLLFLEDTDGDMKADKKTRVLSGFGTEDTHHNLHTLLWGPDGRMYLNQSVYTRTDTETPFGVMRMRGGGGFRLNTENLRMQPFFRGLWNSWGHQFDQYGNSFLTDGAGFAGMAYAFPGVRFRPTPKSRRELDLISPGNWPKFCSEEIIYGDKFPPQWQGSLITCDFRANRVTRFSIPEQGAGFVTEQKDDLLRTSTATFRPIDVKQGPDGALYIADWSNPIINHGEVDFRDPRRDRWHGRIWRVTWDGGTPKKKVDLTTQTTAQLLDNLLSDDRFVRDQSRRVLIQNADEAMPQLKTWLAAQTNETALLQGLWLSQGLNKADHGLLKQLLSAKAPGVRSAAVRVLSDWTESNQGNDVDAPIDPTDAAELLLASVRDESPRVRLEAVRGLGKLNSFEAASKALQVLDQPMDRFLDYALWLSINESSASLLAGLESSEQIKRFNPRHLEFVLTALEPGDSASLLGKYLKSNELPADGSGPWIELIGKAGDASQLTKIFESSLSGSFGEEASIRVLSSLGDAHTKRKIRPANPERIESLIQSKVPQLQAAAIKLAGQWNLGSMVEALKENAIINKVANSEIRGAAIDALRQMKAPAATGALIELANAIPAGPLSANNAQLVSALAASDFQRGLPTIVKSLAAIQNEQVAQQLWRSLLGNKGAGRMLASGIRAAGAPAMSESVARIGLKIAKEEWREKETELIAALTPLCGEIAAAVTMTPEGMKQLALLAEKSGDPHRGESIYRRSNLACITCHAIGGIGGKVGPEMTSLGASAPMDYIVESLFDPNAKIKEGYHSVIVATEDGQLITGIEVQSNDTETVIRTAEDKLIRIPDGEIEGKKNGKSIMPTGVIDGLAEQEKLDLIAFLGRLGKPGQFDASQSGVARRFEVFGGNHRIEQEGVADVIDGTRTKGWKQVDALVRGDLAGSAIKQAAPSSAFTALVNVYLRSNFSVSSERTATFDVTGPKKIVAWIDGKPAKVDPENRVIAALQLGVHTLLIRFDGRAIPDFVRVESQDVTFTTDSSSR